MANISGQEKLLVALVDALEVFGLREHTIERPVRAVVTISVDGEQQAVTEISEDTLTPTWSFSPPLSLVVHASSRIKFTVYRKHVYIKKFNENHQCGEIEMELQTILTNPYTRHILTSPWYSREDGLGLSVALRLEPTFAIDKLLDHAELSMGSKGDLLFKAGGAMKLIGSAIESLEQVMNVVDNIVEIHPICKAAWAALSSVYKAFKDAHTLEKHFHELAYELKDALAYARECQDLIAIPGAVDVVQEIVKLAVESAAVIDGHMRYNVAAKAMMGAMSKAPNKRVLHCASRLRDLKDKLRMTLHIRTWQAQKQIIGLLEEFVGPARTGAHAPFGHATPPFPVHIPSSPTRRTGCSEQLLYYQPQHQVQTTILCQTIKV